MDSKTRDSSHYQDEDEEDWVHIEQEEGAPLYDRSLLLQELGENALTRNTKKSSFVMEEASERNQELDAHPSLQDTPSRLELLSIVRKHSSFLKSSANAGIIGGAEDQLDMRFWRELVDMFFVRGMTKLKTPQDDDLVFFVRQTHGFGLFNEQANIQPYFVRRWAPQLEKVVGESDWEVDWRRSLYLNLIAHTSYTLTVAVCSREVLQNQQRTSTLQVAPVYKVSKTVYASPSRVNFHRDMSKGFETIPAYPDICFMVDDYEDTFEAVILSEPDHCYCVQLNAHGGASLPKEELEVRGSARTNPETVLFEDGRNTTSKLILFSGFVSYDMVRSAFEGGRSKIGGLLLVGSSTPRSEHVIMRGPTGGEVDVSVSSLPDEGFQHASGSSSVSTSKSGIKLGTLMRKAAVAASLAAKQAYVAASTGVRVETDPVPLRCCLMSLTLPWDALAYDLLFKGISNDEK